MYIYYNKFTDQIAIGTIIDSVSGDMYLEADKGKKVYVDDLFFVNWDYICYL